MSELTRKWVIRDRASTTLGIAMNLNQTPTKEQLKSILSAADDGADHHILWVVHGRPRFAKHLFHDQQKVKIAPVHPDFGAAVTATVPDGIC